MKPNISEFSYGYAIVDELLHWHGTAVTAAPVFPSLYQEGQAGGGYDAMLDRGGIPLFLQFKLADCMVRANAIEVQDGYFNPPFYRMHLRPSRHSNQHDMLLALETTGQDVYYVAPAFHSINELNDAYLGHQVHHRSLWLRPSVVGVLPDDGDHHVAFQLPGASVVCSKPRKLDRPTDFDSFEREVEASYRQNHEFGLSQESLEQLADQLHEIGQKRKEIADAQKLAARQELQRREPIERVAFYGNVYFGLQLFIVRGQTELQ